MITKRLLAMVAGTVSCALSVGYIMQHSTSQSHPATPLPLPADIQTAAIELPKPAVIELPVDVKGGSVMTLQDVILTSASPEIQKPIVALSTENLPEIPKDPNLSQDGCAIDANVAVEDMANVVLSVTAPCLRNERVTIHHKGMMFSDATDAQGDLNVAIPALSERAVFIIDFDSGGAKVIMADVPTLSDYKRIAVQWTGASGLEIHAREFGADYGDPGHVWSGSENAARGVVTRLGKSDGLAPRMVEVYTYPAGNSTQSGTVTMSVETEVTQANCGRELTAQSFELGQDGSLRTHELTLAMPNCTTVGDFLVLNNLVDDLKIAAK
jgi:hypothetical protein